jgi:hypothetical protein
VEDAQLRAVWCKSPQEYIMHPAKVSVVIIVRQALPEVFIEGDRVDVILQVVAALLDGALHGFPGVVLGPVSKQVGFPVHDVITALKPEDQVDKAFEKALEVDLGNGGAGGGRRISANLTY